MVIDIMSPNEKRIISFDIGIKNLAYCILDVSSGGCFTILDWNVINLLETGNTSSTVSHKCTHPLKAKRGVCHPPLCGKTAVFSVSSGETFCPRHAKTQTDYLLPTPETAPAAIKKRKIDDLRTFAKTHGVDLSEASVRSQILEKILSFFEIRRLKPIVKPKVKNSNQTDLVQIGKRLKIALNGISGIGEITHVLIENQISTVASRMKTIQGMVAQYFIMILENPQIDFISSANKLKYMPPSASPLENTMIYLGPIPAPVEDSDNDNDEENPAKPQFDKKVYRQHKTDGVKYCLDILSKRGMSQWTELLETHKKKDDLADSFLQGYWYLQKH